MRRRFSEIVGVGRRWFPFRRLLVRLLGSLRALVLRRLFWMRCCGVGRRVLVLLWFRLLLGRVVRRLRACGGRFRMDVRRRFVRLLNFRRRRLRLRLRLIGLGVRNLAKVLRCRLSCSRLVRVRVGEFRLC